MTPRPRTIAVVGAGIAGLACARTLTQAGHAVTLFEKQPAAGGRIASRDTPFGSFDLGAQYFTVRDARFEQALAATQVGRQRWNANAVRVLDEYGRVAEAELPSREAHWVGVPAMDAIAAQWLQPLQAAGRVQLHTRVTRIEPDALDRRRWQLHSTGPEDSVHVFSGFDAVLLALPHAVAASVLRQSGLAARMVERIERVRVAPCWTLMLAFPQAVQPTLSHLGPQWNAAHSAHHRVAWVARESSKPGRSPIERWTVQASPAWSQEHLEDDAPRAQAKLLKAFAEITGIRAEPAHAQVHRWLWARTLEPLGASHLWDGNSGLGLCGDWCVGHRVEDAFVSGLELALAANAG
ncbi:NAD(P)/FAD-dependent oxidoreductase [Ramlibacter sp.]|uniref:NAD(P)/FAD-dependent oxidoreductase n=1 Tax=Ramlibacter sp. TaxID=1917967 RepID=UPI002BC1974B|nr:FAD-dependent oxidoreductase [Ramlibacter sp.]HWI80923.1 FAD-dependent oxidoreductase [Ramlibacter sp.]